MNSSEKAINFEAMIAVLEQVVKSGESTGFSPAGKSMLPTIRDKLDFVTISPASDIKKYDIVLYRRRSKKIVLHRVVKVIDEGSFIMCGDSQFQLEYPVKKEQIIGKVSAIRRGKRLIDCENQSLLYKAYVRLWDLRLIIDKGIYCLKKFLKKGISPAE